MNDILRNAFYEEADEMFQQIEDCLLDIEVQGVTRERIDNLFRYMHTLKGSSSAMGIHDMAKLTHYLEDILGKVREEKLQLSKGIIDQMFLSLDELKIRVAKNMRDEPYEIDFVKHIRPFETYTSKTYDNKNTHEAQRILGEEEANNLIKTLGIEDRLYRIRITLHKNSQLIGARLYIVNDKLKKAGQVHKTGWDGIDYEDIEGHEFEVAFISQLTSKEIEDLIYAIPEIEEVEVSEIDQGINEEHQEQEKENVQSVIRVSIDKLDKLLRLVEELSVDKERLKQLMRGLEQKYSRDDDVKALINLVNQIDFIANEMQESVMSTRMYTLDSVFRRFPRMVRDLSLKQGKEIELKFEGESTELDRSVIEKIIDPLTHIIRNSVDHGIEKPDLRQACGKNPKGMIKVSAGQEEGHIFIRIEDDGRGIDVAKLRESAITKGLLTRDEAWSMTEKAVLEIIFMPGFSTAGEVTDVSGRGVGMNVVKENIEQINGVIDIDNKEGQGLAITFKLPLTLAIIESLLIRSDKYRFSLPLLSIIEILRIKETEYDNNVKFVNGNEVINWRGEILPIIRVSHLFDTVEKQRDRSFIGIVIGFSTSKIILGVEEIIGQQQVVIKPLEKFIGKDNILGELKGISGTVILGDGGFAYVLDVQTLIREMA